MSESKTGLTHLEAAKIVLKGSEPLNSREIVREIRIRQLTEIGGDTPWNTINARISEEIDLNGEDSLFVRAGPGLYALRTYFDGEEYVAPKRQKSSLQTNILVFPSQLIEGIGHFHGILQDYEQYVEKLLNPQTSFVVPRIEAEETEKFKQIVSYVIIRHKNHLLRFTRGKITTVYKYLYGEYSIGFGGHVDQEDWELFSFGDRGFIRSVIRELKEELGLDLENWPEEKYDLKIIGVLNDDSSPLGRRHFAFILLLEIKTEYFRKGIEFDKGEKSVNDLRLVDIDSLSNDFAGYEYWSKLLILNFFSSELETSCHILSTSNFRITQNTKFLLVVGFVGSGKTEACKVLSDEFGYTLVPCSRVMQELIGCGPLETVGRKKLQDEGLKLVSQIDGHKKLAQAIVNYMDQSTGNKFVLDGLRYLETLDEVEKLLGSHVTTIYIETTIDSLHKNYQARSGLICNLKEYINLISHPVEKAVDRFVHRADIVIYNHGSWESYLRAVQEFFANELYP